MSHGLSYDSVMNPVTHTRAKIVVAQSQCGQGATQSRTGETSLSLTGGYAREIKGD